MIRRLALLVAIVSTCTGVRCTISGPGLDPNDPWYPPGWYVPLDEASVEVTIRQVVDGESAAVTAVIETAGGSLIQLDEQQELEVNRVELTGPNGAGYYTAEIPVAREYTLTVTEPTRGVEETTVEAPAEFEITSPAFGGGASLSGFTLEWSNPEQGVQVRLTLSQTVFGDTQTKQLGPFTDSGQLVLTAADLRDFVQGEDLELTISKTRSERDPAGVAQGALSVRVSLLWTLSPRP